MAEITRLDKFLSQTAGISRSEAKAAVKKGEVTVDGAKPKTADMKVDAQTAEIRFNGEKLIYEKFVYIMLNKPQGFISAAKDKRERCVFEFLTNELKAKDVFIAGRLDKDTEGFLLFTNDGSFAHNILSPSKHIPKTYFVKVGGALTDEDVKLIKNGVVIDGEKRFPSRLSILSSGEVSEAEIVICEGKFHQVKRMFEAAGKTVVYLKRTKMGALPLDETLAPGEVKKLTADEVALLQKRE